MAEKIDFKNLDTKPAANSLRISIQLENPEIINELLRFGDKYAAKAEKTFASLVFEAHKYLIRVTPIDTSALRGGWTSWLDENRIDYSRQIFDISIAEKAPGRDYHIDPMATSAGAAYSKFEAPTPFDVTIINEVPYGEYVDDRTAFVELAKYKAEFLFEQIFTSWFKKIQEAQDIVDPDPAEEPTA